MRKLIATVLLTASALTGTATAAWADKPVDIIIEDTAGVLDTSKLIPAVQDIDFHEPTTVAVYTRAGASEDNFNEKVLEYARTEHPEWISADGQKWADGLYLFALDPVGRQVGTYMGEDRKVDLGVRRSIQESTYDHLRDAQWTDGTIRGIEAGAEVINRPWYRSPFFTGLMFFTGLGSAAGAGTWMLVRARNRRLARRAIETGDAAYASVTMNLDATELNTHTIPEQSAYGARVLEKYREFTTGYETVTALSNRVHAFTGKDLKKGANRKTAEQFAAAAVKLDGDDDLIADTNTLLNLYPGWEGAWDRQTAPLKDDLEGITAVLDDNVRHTSTAYALEAFRAGTGHSLETWARDMAAGVMKPETALDRLRDARQALSELLRSHSQTVINTYARTREEARLMRRSMDSSFDRGTRRSSGIVDVAYPHYTYVTIGSFSRGYDDGRSSVSSARHQESRGSSGTGYGSSGGSFSGSGSSSRF